jgi:glycosyltransferase involved in cell wall biosynthesis
MQPAMNVLFVQRQPCIRSLKYAEGLRSTRAEISVSFAYENATLTEFYGHGDELFEEWIPLGTDPAARLGKIAEAREIDLVHCHNGPDTLTNVCLDLFAGHTPVVHDVHDLMSARRTDYHDALVRSRRSEVADKAGAAFVPPPFWLGEERRAMEESDAVIAVSSEIFELARGCGYTFPAETLTYANYTPASFVPRDLPPLETTGRRRPRVVYEGTLNDDGGHYDLREVFTALAGEGLEVHIYPSRDNAVYAAFAQATEGIYYHERLPPISLLEELRQYDAGWAGFNDALNATHLDTVLPNKLFEYIASGLPVISFRHRAMARFLERTGAGLVVDQIGGLRERMGEIRLAATRARDLREEFTVEANIGRVVSLYEGLVARGRAVSSSESHAIRVDGDVTGPG